MYTVVYVRDKAFNLKRLMLLMDSTSSPLVNFCFVLQPNSCLVSPRRHCNYNWANTDSERIESDERNETSCITIQKHQRPRGCYFIDWHCSAFACCWVRPYVRVRDCFVFSVGFWFFYWAEKHSIFSTWSQLSRLIAEERLQNPHRLTISTYYDPEGEGEDEALVENT